jgi:hypothetical protein
MEVKLSHALEAKTIASAKVKKDKTDCGILAHLLTADLIPQSYVAAKPIGMQSEFLGYRASLGVCPSNMRCSFETSETGSSFSFE